MERAVFQADSVTQITDRQFIALKVDYDAWSTKPLVEKYRVAGLPTFIILDSLEAVERRVPGRLTVAEFVRFLTPPAAQTGDASSSRRETPLHELRDDSWAYQERQIENARWKVEAGIQSGVNLTQVSPLAPGRKAGYDISLLLVCTKRRISIRPGLSLMSVGGRLEDGQPLRLQHVALPVNLSYLLRRARVLGLPGGYRAIFNPYVARLINSPNLPVNSYDYGSKLGLSVFVGETSQIEAQLGYQLGLKNVGGTGESGLYNRGIYFAVMLVF